MRWLLVFLVACSAPVAPGPPRAVPELYGAGLFSTGAWDFFLAFSPDQRRVLFCRADDAFQRYEILETRFDGRWSPPVRPAFATAWSNADPHFSPDGRRVVFLSNRPNPGETAERATMDIWSVDATATGWGEPARVPISDPALDEWAPALAANGNLYFGQDRPDGTDLYVSRLVDGVYQPPDNLGPAINTPGLEVEPWISPDEQTLIFSALRRTDSLGGYDLYISHKVGGAWAPARRLPEPINTTAREFTPSVSPDGRWLYFSSTRPHTGALGPRLDDPRDDAHVTGIGDGAHGDLYRVPTAALP
jgi:hypothetical protein